MLRFNNKEDTVRSTFTSKSALKELNHIKSFAIHLKTCLISQGETGRNKRVERIRQGDEGEIKEHEARDQYNDQ